MTPKEKAKELVDKFYNEIYPPKDTNYQAKKCALIAVEESLKSEYNVLTRFRLAPADYISAYWQQVKKEIELL